MLLLILRLNKIPFNKSHTVTLSINGLIYMVVWLSKKLDANVRTSKCKRRLTMCGIQTLEFSGPLLSFSQLSALTTLSLVPCDLTQPLGEQYQCSRLSISKSNVELNSGQWG